MIPVSEWIARETPRVLRFKLDAERTFMPEIKRHFAAVRRSMTAPPGFRPVFERQYRRVISRLVGVRTKNENEDELRGATVFALEPWIAQRSMHDAILADGTTDKQIAQAFRLAREELPVGTPESVVERVAGRIFRRLSAGRVTNIAVTETQAVTEQTRAEMARQAHDALVDPILAGDQDEARDIAEFGGDYASYRAAEQIGVVGAETLLLALVLSQKRWQTMRDELVRPAHAAALGQTVPTGTPFVVKGQLLMHPGDTSMGATIDNVANCRCWETSI